MSGTPQIFVINGPNLNLLGVREPEIYGTTKLTDIEKNLKSLAQQAEIGLHFMQSNAEHELINAVHSAFQHAATQKYILINPAAYTHTSIALRDALLGSSIPFIEVHLSNVFAREGFRQHSYLSDCAQGVICGFGAYGYELAFQAALHHLSNKL